MATSVLPRLVVLNVPKAGTDTYVYRKDDGSVVAGDDNMFSLFVKIEVERAKDDDRRVHLRFTHNNKYWGKSANDASIVAVSKKPDEDTTKQSCTLFEVNQQSDNAVYFTHVQTGWRVMMNNSTGGLYVEKNSAGAPLGFIDWDTLVKLPKHVAFLGDNGKYLKAYGGHDGINYLQFGSDDPNDVLSGHEVQLMRDGHVRIKSDLWGLFWRRASDWIQVDSDESTASNKDSHFWPVRISDNMIALRSAGNSNFCKRFTHEVENCLNAGVTNITSEARLRVQELVMERKIYNVKYRMEDARIYGETPYLAGATTATNHGSEAASIAVMIKYEDQTSYGFTCSESVTAGVSGSITAGVPGIGEASIEISTQITSAFEWNTTTSVAKEVTATGTVTVPARSVAVVHYVGTKGTCDVPFSYTQQDRSSTDGKISVTDKIDGVFSGVNNYNFQFTIQKHQPLSA